MYWMLSKAHHSKRETNRKRTIPSVTSIKDNANRNISHSGTCTRLKKKWTPIATDRDIAQLVRIVPWFRSERAWNQASHWEKKRKKNRRAEASRVGVWRGERALLDVFFCRFTPFSPSSTPPPPPPAKTEPCPRLDLRAIAAVGPSLIDTPAWESDAPSITFSTWGFFLNRKESF